MFGVISGLYFEAMSQVSAWQSVTLLAISCSDVFKLEIQVFQAKLELMIKLFSGC